MRRLLILLALAAAVLMAAMTGLVVLFSSNAEAEPRWCLPTLVFDDGSHGRGRAEADNLDGEQRSIAQQIITLGRASGVPARGWQVALQAGMTESRLRNLNYGDQDSLGIFQMRPSMGWGTPSQLQDVPYQIRKFYEVLTQVPDWEKLRPGEAAQRVERSAFPERYHQWEPMAAYLVASLGAVDDPSGCGGGGGVVGASDARVATVISFARAQLGKPYVWGAEGPNSFDCSGLMMAAYRTAGISLPRTSREQFHAGRRGPLQQAEPGDLIFWAHETGNPASIHHVAMYLGDNKIVEAQQTGVPVHIRPLNFTESGLMSQFVRPAAR